MAGIGRRSIRFRLTAWYTAILAVAIAAFAFATFALLSRQLDSSTDRQLATTALSIQRNSQISAADGVLRLEVPPLDPFRIAGFFVEGYQYPIAGNDDPTVFYKSSNLGIYDLPARPETKGSRGVDFFTTTLGGDRIRAAKVEAFVPGTNATLGQVIVGVSTAQLDHTLNQLKRTILFGSLAALIFAVLGGWFLAGRALHPVERMRQAARRIASEQTPGILLTERIDDPGTDDELSRLAQTFNELLAQIERAFANERRFIADASHELRTPLTAIRGNVDVLLLQAGRSSTMTAEQREALEDTRRDIARMARLLEDLLTLARTDAALPDSIPPATPIGIAAPLHQALRTAQHLAPDHTIVLELESDPIVSIDPDRLVQTALILLDNAIRHSSTDTPITVRVQTTATDALIAIEDRGEGIAAEHLPHLFERFYRADSARSRADGGTGLGLAIARAMIRQYGGDITVQSEPGQGAIFTIKLPRAFINSH